MSWQSELSVVIPFRHMPGHRDRIAEWVCTRYDRLFGDVEFKLGTMTSDFPLFCRSEAINNGVRATQRPFLLIADVDVLVNPAAIERAVDDLSSAHPPAWVLPYNVYHELDEQSTERFLQTDPTLDPTTIHATMAGSYQGSRSSLAILSRETFWSVGGFDERFKGWAPEDQAWADAVTTLCGPAKRLADWDLYHLWHPVTEGTTADNPHYAESDRLWTRYKAAVGNPTAMRQLVLGEVDGNH